MFTCRVLYDWMGSRRLTPRILLVAPPRSGSRRHLLRQSAKLQNSLGWISRDHRKLLCVDGGWWFTGGLYRPRLGRRSRRGVRPGGIRWSSPGAGGRPARGRFADSWAMAGAPIAPDARRAPRYPAAGSLGLWVIPGRPEPWGSIAWGCSSPRSASSRSGSRMPILSRRPAGMPCAGPRGRVSMSGCSFPGQQFPAGRRCRGPAITLLEAGVRVFEWNGPMMHAKTAVADGRWSRIGSSNSNLASWIANRELDIAVEDPGFAGQMEAMFEQDL